MIIQDGYTVNDVKYQWEGANPVYLSKGMELAQFDLVNVTTEPEKFHERGGLHYSILQTNYWLKRHTGYFMLQVSDYSETNGNHRWLLMWNLLLTGSLMTRGIVLRPF